MAELALDLQDQTISSALEAMRKRQFSALDLVEACFKRIKELNPELNAFITPTLELGVQVALSADSLYAEQPSNIGELALLGIPVAVKDLIDVMGVPTTGGSQFFGNSLPEEDALSVLRLKLAGGVILGKTNTHEVALGVTGINPHFGAARNPWNPLHITGGSSSGSAAAVAAGMCLASIGTDTGGSVRIPASLCGVVGLKPTFGRVSMRGVLPLSWNLDHVGVLARTVRDAALVLGVIAGFDPHDPVSQNVPTDDYTAGLDAGVRGWRVAVATGDFIDAAEADVLGAFTDAAAVFRDLGAAVEKIEVDWLRDAARANGLMTQADAAAFHRERLEQAPEKFGADVLERLQAGRRFSSTDYALARRTQVETRRTAEIFFEKYDLMLLPSTPVPAFPIEGTQSAEVAGKLTRFTAPFDLTGLPAISVPCGFTLSGLPLGLQLVSRHWGEVALLQGAQAYEKATEWHSSHPKI